MKQKILGALISLVVIGLVFGLCQARAGPHPELEPGEEPLISMDFQDADLKDVLKVFSQQAGLNFIASEKVKDRKVTLYLDEVSLEDALHNIIEANDLVYKRAEDSDIFIVKEMLRPEVETTTRVFTLNYATAYRKVKGEEGEGAGESETETDIVGVVRGLLTSHGSLQVDRRTNSLVVTDISLNFSLIEETIAKLDLPAPQVMIEVEILETSLATLEALGLEWGGSSGRLLSLGLAESGLDFPYRSIRSGIITAGQFGTGDITAILELLSKDTETEILARPRILTLNNETAQIKITADTAIALESITVVPETGREIITPERVETGITLRVTPTINEDNRITMLIEPEVSRTQVSKISSSVYDPIRRSTRTTVMVDDGETIVIGGLIETQDERVMRKVPILGDIPILGLLFRKKGVDRTDRELIIFITPYVVRKEKTSASRAGGSVVEPKSAPSLRPENRGLLGRGKESAIQRAMKEAVARVPLVRR